MADYAAIDAARHTLVLGDSATISEIRASYRALLPANGRVLDIGCGSGRFSAALGATAGCDRSLAPLALARKRNARVVVADAVALPFATAGADALLLVTVARFHNTHEIAALFVAAGFSPQSFVRPSDAGGLTFFSVCNKKDAAVVRG